MSTYDHIAHKNGELFTAWGPCFCDPGGVGPRCAACRNADRIEAAGLDWEEEYQKHCQDRERG